MTFVVTVKQWGQAGRKKRGDCFVKGAKNLARLADKRVEPTCEQGYTVPGKMNNKLAQRMNYNTKQTIEQFLRVRLQLLVVISCVGLALMGQVPESSGGWLACRPWVVSLSQAVAVGKGRQTARQRARERRGRDWGRLKQGWQVPVGRSLVLSLMWLGSGPVGSVYLGDRYYLY